MSVLNICALDKKSSYAEQIHINFETEWITLNHIIDNNNSIREVWRQTVMRRNLQPMAIFDSWSNNNITVKKHLINIETMLVQSLI